MKKTFIEMKLFQVKPDKLEQFEAKIEEMTANQFKCEGCISLKDNFQVSIKKDWDLRRRNYELS